MMEQWITEGKAWFVALNPTWQALTATTFTWLLTALGDRKSVV